jgi:hypothetical protein
MYDYQSWEFTCKTCGGQRLTVSRVWLTLAGSEIERWQETGPLKANHLWMFRIREKVEKEIDPNKEDEVQRWDFSEYTKRDSPYELEDYKIFALRGYPIGDKFYVNCADCDREIEFGWSQSNRGGRIYPVECSDFIPENVWPDPKYVKVWQQRGWIRRGHSQP